MEYRDETKEYEEPQESTSKTFRNDSYAPEETKADYFNEVNINTRRITNALSDSITLDGSTIVIDPNYSLQAAIDTIRDVGGGKIYLTAGTYTIDTPLVGISNIKIIGESYANTFIDFNSTSANLSFTGVTDYDTGTVTGVTSGVIVTGNGTSWTTLTSPSSKQLFLDNKWYRIASVTNDTTLILSEAVTDTLSYPISYKIGTPKEDIDIHEIAFKNSTGTALAFTDCRDIDLKNVIFQSNNKGIVGTGIYIISSKKVFALANTSNGFEFVNSAFASFEDMLAIGNGGNGWTFNNCKTMPIFSSAAISNVADGINFTDTSDIYLEMEMTGNGGQGAELVSGNETILFRQCSIKSNVSDGIKFTATSDECGTIGCNIESNGGYGINIAAATCDDIIVSSNILKSNVAGNGNDSGTGTVIRGNVGWADNATYGYAQFWYGGDGSDGALTTSGDVTLTSDKYYTNLTVSTGDTIYTAGYRIFCTETLTVNGTISRNGNAASFDAKQHAGANDGNHGQAGVGATALAAGYLSGALAGSNGGTGGTNSVGNPGTAGTNISNSIGTNGKAGGQGGDTITYPANAPGGAGGTATAANTRLAVQWNYMSVLDIETAGTTTKYKNSAGAGGGGGGAENTGTYIGGGGGGGGGAGGIIASYAKDIVISATGVIEVIGGDGANGGDGISGGFAGGGGGGAGGNGGIIILGYQSLTNSGSINVSGGSGGTAGAYYTTDAATNGENGDTGTIYYFNFS